MREKYTKAVYEGKQIFTAKWIEVMCVDEIIQKEEKMLWSCRRLKALDREDGRDE